MDQKVSHSFAHYVFRTASKKLGLTVAPFWLRSADRYGRRSRLIGAPYVENWGTLRIGDDFTLCSLPAESHLVTGPRGAISIGNGVTIESGAAIAAEEQIEIGDGVTIGPRVMIMDTDFHDPQDLASRGATAPVIIEQEVHIESDVTILKGTHLQKGARVAKRSVVSGVVPEGAYACGVPARAFREPPCRQQNTRLPESGDLLQRINAVAARTFDVKGTPMSEDGTCQLAHWDSLGALRLLISIEEEFQITLPEDALCEVSTLQELSHIVVDALARSATA
jgi:acetyltransferase-like isoleucine patch superfamily enzyme/acyl carrier protein